MSSGQLRSTAGILGVILLVGWQAGIVAWHGARPEGVAQLEQAHFSTGDDATPVLLPHDRLGDRNASLVGRYELTIDLEKLRALARIFNVSVQNFSDVLDLERYESQKPDEDDFGELLRLGSDLVARGEHGRAFVTFERALEVAGDGVTAEGTYERIVEARWRMATTTIFRWPTCSESSAICSKPTRRFPSLYSPRAADSGSNRSQPPGARASAWTGL